jgi:hypothetical protein
MKRNPRQVLLLLLVSALPVAAQSNQEITESNWHTHPKIVAIRKMVQSTDQRLKAHKLKSYKKDFQACEDDALTFRRIVKDANGRVLMYEGYHEGREDSSSLYNQYYDDAGKLRFALVTVYAANGTREEHRAYYDESGKIIWRNRKLLKGPGYFQPPDIEELPKEDAAKEFSDDTRCVSTRPKPAKKSSLN